MQPDLTKYLARLQLLAVPALTVGVALKAADTGSLRKSTRPEARAISQPLGHVGLLPDGFELAGIAGSASVVSGGYLDTPPRAPVNPFPNRFKYARDLPPKGADVQQLVELRIRYTDTSFEEPDGGRPAGS